MSPECRAKKHTTDMQKLDHTRKAISKSSTIQNKIIAHCYLFESILNKHFYFRRFACHRVSFFFFTILNGYLNETKDRKVHSLRTTHIS